MLITGSQCRAARALVEIDRGWLSLESGIDAEIISNFEKNLATPDDRSIRLLRTALEKAGAVFIEERDGGIGVRLKFTQADARRIATLEGEGGNVGLDDVP